MATVIKGVTLIGPMKTRNDVAKRNMDTIVEFFSLYLKDKARFYSLWVAQDPEVVTPFVSDDVAVIQVGVHAGWKAVKAFWDPIFDEMQGRFDWFVDEFIPGEDPDTIVTRSHSKIDVQAGKTWGNKHIAYTGRYVQLFRFVGGKVKSFEEYYDTALLNSKYGHKSNMRPAPKVIITCAVTGSIHTPTMSPYLPITPAQIAADSIAAAAAGAAMVHLHARDPKTGKPSQDPALFAQFLPQIKKECDAIINITTGGGLGMTLDQRLAPALWAKPEIASMNMGSLNFNISAAASKIREFQFDWERPYLEMTKDLILSNTFAQIERGLKEMGDNGTRFEFECYDIGHLYNLAHFADRQLAKPPFFIQGVFGILGGMGADPENLMHLKATADRLFGNDYYLSVLAAGRHQMAFTTLSAILGGSVRVGLEDSLYAGRGKLATSNAEQVAKIRHILEELSLEIATPDEARAMLQTKGRDNVGFGE